MRTEELIQQLVADARPVQRLSPFKRRMAGWSVIAVTSFAVVLLVTGARRELGDAMVRADFMFETALLLLTAVSAAAGALMISVPGGERTSAFRWVPVILCVATILWAAGELVMAAATGAPTGSLTFAWQCMMKTSMFAVVPGIALFVMLRRAAPLRAGWAGLLAVLATAAVGVLGANVACPNDRPVHMLLWHVLPLVLFAGAGAALGTWLLRWPAPVKSADGRAPLERRD